MAPHGSTRPDELVQGSDPRLRGGGIGYRFYPGGLGEGEPDWGVYHNLTLAKQGGVETDEFYHLSAAEHTALTTQQPFGAGGVVYADGESALATDAEFTYASGPPKTASLGGDFLVKRIKARAEGVEAIGGTWAAVHGDGYLSGAADGYGGYFHSESSIGVYGISGLGRAIYGRQDGTLAADSAVAALEVVRSQILSGHAQTGPLMLANDGSGSGANLLDLRVGGVQKFVVDATGAIGVGGGGVPHAATHYLGGGDPVDHAQLPNLDYASAGHTGFVPRSRTISTTAPLTGGGSLSSDRTLTLGGLSGYGAARQIIGVVMAGGSFEYKWVVGTTNQIDIEHEPEAIAFSTPQDIHTGASPTFNSPLVTHLRIASGAGKGVRFWASDTYKIHMGNTAEYHYGPVTDYSIKTNMSANSGRGWTWGVATATPVAALSNTGIFQIASNCIVGGHVYLSGVVYVDGVQVVENQGAAIADVPTGGGAMRTANAVVINLILNRLRTHGLIDT